MISKHFKLYELVPKELFETLNDRLLWSMLDPKLIEMLDKIKEVFNEGTMTVNSWYWGGDRNWSGIRTKDSKWYSATSQHAVGKAFDAVFSKYTAEEVRQYIINNPKEFPYIKGIELDKSWLHFDTRSSDQVRLFKA